MKKKVWFLSVLLAVGAVAAPVAGRFNPYPQTQRQVRIGAVPRITLGLEPAGHFAIVIPVKAPPVVRYAAQELSDRLFQVTGFRAEPRHQAEAGGPVFLLGATPEAAALGLDPARLDRDGFFIRTDGDRILLLGQDDPAGRPERGGRFERGTLFAVYDFLERFAGVRYYFPGEIGTLAPRQERLLLPEIDLVERPDNTYRRIYCTGVRGLGSGQLEGYPGLTLAEIDRLSAYTLRQNTIDIPNCHGLAELGLVQRFARTHPEYFALRDDGRRHDGSVVTRDSDKTGQLCFSSAGLKEEIYQDAAALLTGKTAAERGIVLPNGKSYWVASRHKIPFFNIMPNDAMYLCRCADCQRDFAAGPQGISNHIWRFKTDIARRLQENGIPGYVTVMAYAQYKAIPEVEIPDNCIVMLALTGPWNELNASQREADGLLQEWNRKLQARTYLWTYTTKCGNMIADVPNFTPRAVGNYFKRQAPYIFGSFLESETDFWLFGYLNFYVFSRVMWDTGTDVEALLDEHCRLMFGAGAPPMRQVYDAFEEHWLRDIMSRVYETSAGPKVAVPSQYEVWNGIYNPAEMGRLEALFDRAAELAANDADALRRIDFIRQELWGKVRGGQERYRNALSAKEEWKGYMPAATEPPVLDGVATEAVWQQAPAVWMIPRRGDRSEVQTRVRMLHDAENFYFAFACDEPHTGELVEVARPFDDVDLWRDNLVEIFLSADRQSSFMYQFMVGSNGCLTDSRNQPGVVGTAWNSGFAAATAVQPGEGWSAEVRIPRRSMPELGGETVVANFTRGRMLRQFKPQVPYYTWSDFPRQSAENCGTLVLAAPPAEPPLVADGDFAAPKRGARFLGAWFSGEVIHADREVFRTAGVSARLSDACAVIRQYLPRLRSSRRYRLTFWVKLEEVSPTDEAGGGFYLDLRYGNGLSLHPYNRPLTGTIPWIRQSFEFSTPAAVGRDTQPYIGFNRRLAAGTVWLDKVEISDLGAAGEP